ncbi:hypothetical protein N0V90_003649 [Kalmusia sp. IMI 367209]|nr:hypothetical protein N0V90_003649 [Kalmusia sp. IMI 367209]
MKFFAILSVSALAVLAAALPQADNGSAVTEPVDIGTIPPMPDTLKDGTPVASNAGDDKDPEKRDFEERDLEKRDFKIDIWQDPNKGGRHESLQTVELTVPGSAKTLKNLKKFHFNDQISSYLCYNN